jgi:hypothetical protein
VEVKKRYCGFSGGERGLAPASGQEAASAIEEKDRKMQKIGLHILFTIKLLFVRC